MGATQGHHGEATSVRLSGLLAAERPPEAPVAWRWDSAQGRDVAIPWSDFRARVDAVAAQLVGLPEGALILACDDRYAFGVGLFGAWQARRLVLAPPNAQPDTIHRIADRAVGVLSDRHDVFGGRMDLEARLDVIDPLQATEAAPGPARPGALLDPSAEVLELFTSGTTGDGKTNLKLLAHLEEEVAYLAKTWGAAVAGARVFSTASHQHLYGLLFGLLWPLCSARPFQADTLIHAAELFPRMLASERCMLASVPSHLRRMVAHRDAAQLRGHCVVSFSSGGPLAEATADAWAQTVGAAPIEIFGSTETGGVAWRTQRPGPDRLTWQPFGVVECERVEEDGSLHVRSPFIGPVQAAEPGAARSEGFTMGDRVRMEGDGRFVLEGRGDRVVKIGEKRVSLPLMEQHLAAHAHVEDAAVVLVEQQGEARLAAVLVPSEAGFAFEAARGRRAFVSDIGDHLAGSWDRVLLPRLWRLVEAMPENEQGKVTARRLADLFASDGSSGEGVTSEVGTGAASERPRPREAEVVSERAQKGRIVQQCVVPDDLAQLEGHFAGLPIVPGVVQLQWAVALAGRVAASQAELEVVEALKFKRRLGAGDAFELRVEQIGADVFTFVFEHDDDVISSGRLRFASGGAR